MRLTQIKLAGFKSFVDVTKIPFNQPLTAIIGPNGCGKSNVIDAVRWVLGESSAKHLRGDSMADVIFNGSSARRPVSVASVELTFDNQQGRLAGQYASYQEIAVKRQVSRDGDSSYFLNGQKCRRKDITDLFMGTGLGPRSYAIIEQGTISRLIESKPQELRVFIEEAAGISRYKERRRETENRIRHTRENLERLGDIRQELGMQIEKLAEQAKAAKRYRELKQQERTQDSELHVARWLELQSQLEKLTQSINQKLLTKSELDAAAQLLQTQITKLTLQIEDLASREQTQVEDFYQNATQIAKLEQGLKHRQEQDAHLNARVDELIKKRIAAEEELAQLQQAAKALQSRYADTASELQGSEQQLSLLDEQLIEAELHLEQDNEQLREKQQQQHQHQLQTQSRVSEQKHLNTSLARKGEQRSHLQKQLSQLSSDEDNRALALQQEKCEQLQLQVQQTELSHRECESLLAQLEQQEKQHLSQIQTLSQVLSEARGRYQVVERLLPQDDETEGEALWQTLEVTPGWEVAVDLVLEGVLTQAVLNQSVSNKTALNKTETQQGEEPTGFSRKGESQQWQGVKTWVNLAPWMSHLHWAQDLEQAKQMLNDLAEHERIVTADGYLLGHGFLLQQSAKSDNLVQLKIEQQALVSSIKMDEESLTELNALHCECNEQLQTCRQNLRQMVQQQQEIQLDYERTKAQLEAIQTRIYYSAQQAESLQTQVEALVEEMMFEQQQLDSLLEQIAEDQALSHQFSEQYELCRTRYSQSHELAKRLKQSRSEQVIKSNQSQRQLQSIETEGALNEQQVRQYQTLIEECGSNLAKLDEQLQGAKVASSQESVAQIGQRLEISLEAQQHKQQQLDTLRRQQAQLQSQVDEIEAEQKQQLEKIDDLTQGIGELKLRREGIKGQADSQQSQLEEYEIDVAAMQATIDLGVSINARQKALERIRGQITQLGAINLAAIEEYEQQSERKHYLDTQDADLNKALNSLEEAIRKIDKETKIRFKATFDKVNQDLGILFPKVFGGGSAYLALTDDDLLETGVTIMARPPGKKNSTIHLLSGGEKALTALSLVFAIFRLNPAPFCMLDEVDAPLDDANVDRFCRLVKEMSQSVQFVYISHNKITMELADQLTGVTMHEPGVSRIVAVDIDEAVALADAG
ncbi:chromosome segregation protein SMC [Shewanella sp. AS1]|uniref:chromosome segregation protein SMC n=1 Tax=Shewanella sp. AS1 TaxID=2907626 RepID=UPI001F3F31B7|nr:chromosome segregation protein SMC [Shewanella sp. AS1]MCE9679576.1 chromosome segregation protein SMC [Shewanella sp. AS1]